MDMLLVQAPCTCNPYTQPHGGCLCRGMLRMQGDASDAPEHKHNGVSDGRVNRAFLRPRLGSTVRLSLVAGQIGSARRSPVQPAHPNLKSRLSISQPCSGPPKHRLLLRPAVRQPRRQLPRMRRHGNPAAALGKGALDTAAAFGRGRRLAACATRLPAAAGGESGRPIRSSGPQNETVDSSHPPWNRGQVGVRAGPPRPAPALRSGESVFENSLSV